MIMALEKTQSEYAQDIVGAIIGTAEDINNGKEKPIPGKIGLMIAGVPGEIAYSEP